MIAYHGTDEACAASIRKNGFIYGTYFAYKVEDAFVFGGRNIFVVRFSDDPAKWRGEADGWQFWVREHIPPTAIINEVKRGCGSGNDEADTLSLLSRPGYKRDSISGFEEVMPSATNTNTPNGVVVGAHRATSK